MRLWNYGAVLACLSLGACGATAKTGVEIDPQKVSQIQKGVTTRAEVEALLGSPETVGMLSEGRRMLMYRGSQLDYKPNANHWLGVIPVVGSFLPKSSDTTTRRQVLQITLSKNGVVEDYEFSDTTTEHHDASGGLSASSETTTKQNQPAK